MPKTGLFETELRVPRTETVDKEDEGLCSCCGETIEDYELINPGMTFRMDYTHTRNYQSEKASVQVTVVSIEKVILKKLWIYITGCVLKTEEPIYICVHSAALGEDIYLFDKDDKLVAQGGVHTFLDPGAKNFT